jgi:transposase
MKKQQYYTPEFRAEAVKLDPEQGLSQQEAAKRLSILKGALANRMATTHTSENRPTPPETRYVADLEAENERLHKELAEVSEEGDGVLCQGVAARYAFMKQWRLLFPITVMCRVLGLSRGGFYAWLGAKAFTSCSGG